MRTFEIIQESRADKLALRYLKSKGVDDYNEQMNIIGSLKHDIPNLRLDKGKYVLGALRMLYDDMSLNNEQNVRSLDNVLKYIHAGNHQNEYDENLNGLSLSDLSNTFRELSRQMSDNDRQRSAQRQFTGESEYKIIPVNSYEEAQTYGKYTSWCVTHGKGSFGDYTKGGKRFYFCLKNGFASVAKKAGDNAPLDEYGLSMIAVNVDIDGELTRITTRWNHEHNGENNPGLETTEQLEDVLGVRFYDVFKPYTSDELRAMGIIQFNEVPELLAQGREPIEIFSSVGNFIDGFARVELNDKYNFIGTNGKLLSPNQWFDYVGREFRDGFAMVKLNSKYNFIDTNCNLSSPNQWFDYVGREFRDGFAMVKLNDKYNFIGTNGKLLSPNQWFDYVGNFRDGHARVELNGQWCIVDVDGALFDQETLQPIGKLNESLDLITESRADKVALRFLKDRGITSYKEQMQYIGAVKHDVPMLRLDKGKFVAGALRLYFNGELSDGESIAALNRALKLINKGNHSNEYDELLNNMSVEQLGERYRSEALQANSEDAERSLLRQFDGVSQYNIIPVDDFETAHKYSLYTSWCVTRDETAYKNYTNGGARFYFCLRNGFESVKEEPGEGCPLDEYGLSMISVCVDEDGSPQYITTRWNHDYDGENNENLSTAEQLEDIIGVSFYKTFKPYTEEELKDRGQWRDPIIGKQVLYCGMYGWIMSADRDNGTYDIISCSARIVDNWDEVEAYESELHKEWYIPKKGDLQALHDNYAWFTRKTGLFADEICNGDDYDIVTNTPYTISYGMGRSKPGYWCLHIPSGEWYKAAFSEMEGRSIVVPITTIRGKNIESYLTVSENVVINTEQLRSMISEAVSTVLQEAPVDTYTLYHGGNATDDPFHSGVAWLSEDSWYAAHYCEGKEDPCIWEVTINSNELHPASIYELGDDFDPYDVPSDETKQWILDNGYNSYTFPLSWDGYETTCVVLLDESAVQNITTLDKEEVLHLMQEEGIA